MMKPYIPTLSKIWGWCEISHEQMRRLRGKKKKKKKIFGPFSCRGGRGVDGICEQVRKWNLEISVFGCLRSKFDKELLFKSNIRQ